MKVRCYWNLRKGCWSIQDARTRKVLAHAERVLLRDVAFTVSEAGRKRVIAEGHKNVHAFAVGNLEAIDWLDDLAPGRSPLTYYGWHHTSRANNAYAAAASKYGKFVSYNPRRDASFVTVEGETRTPVAQAPMAYLASAGKASSRKAALLAFEPCDMTAEESARATQ